MLSHASLWDLSAINAVQIAQIDTKRYSAKISFCNLSTENNGSVYKISTFFFKKISDGGIFSMKAIDFLDH